MKSAAPILAIVAMAGSAAAQTTTRPPAANQTNAGGAATVKSHMQSLGYKEIHELRQAPDGRWVGKATRNGVEHTVTVQPRGATTAR